MTAVHETANWRTEALCAQVDPELFFPETDRSGAFEEQVAAAKQVCAACAVRQRCLDHALRSLPDGIAGGMTPGERAQLRRGKGVDLEFVPVELMPRVGVMERAAAGREAAATGASTSQLVRRFGVAHRTAHRWHADARLTRNPNPSTSVPGVEEGSPAATGTPLRISTAIEALAGNRAPEGHED
ncbi:WhiB family transcriptional regulator [Pseudonocardia sp. N23]|uniref:WhiB family transcriptional regulator n=1 Tax=Pseudonocardia sp. N23 TaxID=1987376 RepID=UPI000BFB5F81|nr:WhiB family transcriptional regulator [Pseudonocardia sp. N23]